MMVRAYAARSSRVNSAPRRARPAGHGNPVPLQHPSDLARSLARAVEHLPVGKPDGRPAVDGGIQIPFRNPHPAPLPNREKPGRRARRPVVHRIRHRDSRRRPTTPTASDGLLGADRAAAPPERDSHAQGPNRYRRRCRRALASAASGDGASAPENPGFATTAVRWCAGTGRH